MATNQRNWAPFFRNLLLTGGFLSSWWTMASGEMPYSMWLGISAIILAGAFGSNLVLVGSALGLFFVRYALFIMPVSDLLHTSRLVSSGLTLGFSIWETAPLWIAGMVGVWLLRRKTIHGGIVFGLPASLFLALATWLPRPYYFSWGAPFLARFPGFIWMFGSDLLAALTLGWICVAARSIVYGNRSKWHAVAIAGAPLIAYLICFSSYEAWCGSMIKAPSEAQDVIAVQGALPPFAGGYVVTLERMVAPVVLYSSLHPDLVIFPEAITQIGGQIDGNDADSVTKRRFAAISVGLAAPYSQVLYGCRDWNTNRMMFSDLIDGKPDITWKDEEYRTPFVDFWPSSMGSLVRRYGFASSEQIRPAERTPSLNILVRDATAPRGLRRIGGAEIFMSGEIRRPLLVSKIRNATDHSVMINPTIGGWLGGSELHGSIVQADARALELGTLLYRVGQLGGTGLFVPWLPDPDDEAIHSYGAGVIRFKANIPTSRHDTGFTKVFWVALYLSPLLSGLLAFAAAWSLRKAWKESQATQPTGIIAGDFAPALP